VSCELLSIYEREFSPLHNSSGEWCLRWNAFLPQVLTPIGTFSAQSVKWSRATATSAHQQKALDGLTPHAACCESARRMEMVDPQHRVQLLLPSICCRVLEISSFVWPDSQDAPALRLRQSQLNHIYLYHCRFVRKRRGFKRFAFFCAAKDSCYLQRFFYE
jgi:hypothetical protein